MAGKQAADRPASGPPERRGEGRGDDRPVLVGRIGAPHGLRGEIRLWSFTDEPMALLDYSPLGTSRAGLTVTVLSARPDKAGLIAKLAGVTDRNAAALLTGLDLTVPRERLPPPDDAEEFYQADLIGLEARLADGTVLGRVVAVPNYGADDLLEVASASSGATTLYPFTRLVVPRIDVAAGFLVIVPPQLVEAEDVPAVSDAGAGLDPSPRSEPA